MPRKTDQVRYVFEIGNGFDSCPAAYRIGCEGIGAFALCALWSISNGTPGQIPCLVAGQYGGHLPPRLVQAGLWRDSGDGYVMVPSKYWRFVKLTRYAEILASLRQKIYARDGRKCVYCGSAEDLTLDHIYPKSLGGPDTEDNLQTLCRPCNSSKGATV